jgi:hypothetical protein
VIQQPPNFDIIYKRLLKEFQPAESWFLALHDTAAIEDYENSAIHPLDFNGYAIVIDTANYFVDGFWPTQSEMSFAGWPTDSGSRRHEVSIGPVAGRIGFSQRDAICLSSACPPAVD